MYTRKNRVIKLSEIEAVKTILISTGNLNILYLLNYLDITQFSDFLDVFGGQKMEVITKKEFNNLLRDAIIYITLCNTNKPDRKAYRIKELSGKYEISESEVEDIYKKMKNLVKLN